MLVVCGLSLHQLFRLSNRYLYVVTQIVRKLRKVVVETNFVKIGQTHGIRVVKQVFACCNLTLSLRIAKKDESIKSEFPNSGYDAGNRLEEQVYRQLLDKIRFGTFAWGDRLPSENELAEEYGVSRPVVRAALAKLRDSGLIVSRRGAGSFVNSGNVSEQNGYSPLKSIEDIACFFRFRKTIEIEAAELAARNAGAVGVERLRGIVVDAKGRLDQGEAAVELDIKFHATVAELSGSRFLIETIEMLQPQWRFVGNFVRSLGMFRQRTGEHMTTEHLQLVEAIATGDGPTARNVMTMHINESERRVFKGE